MNITVQREQKEKIKNKSFHNETKNERKYVERKKNFFF